MLEFNWEPKELFGETNQIDGRPFFYSKGSRILIATGCETQCTFFDEKDLNKFHAKRLTSNVTLDVYWQLGKQMGDIYRLDTFPVDGSDIVFRDILVFNIAKLKGKSNLCGIFSGVLFDKLTHSFNAQDNPVWGIAINEDMKSVDRANEFLQQIVRDTPTF